MRRQLGLGLIVAMCGGCANDPVVGPSVRDSALVATTWTVASVQPNGQPELAAPVPATFTMTLEGGRVAARVDCNACGGAYSLSGVTLTVSSPMICTLAACPGMAFGSQYLALLGGESTVDVSESALTLSSARGVLRLRR